MKEPWRERWIRSDVKEIIIDLKWYVIAFIAGGLIVGAINGIYALCEMLKSMNVS